MEGVDYAFSPPSAVGLATAGKRFAMRYIGPGTSDKWLTQTEAKRLATAGLSIVYLVEGTAGGAMGGRPAGVSHAATALDYARHNDWPLDRPMYFAVDFDASAAQWPTVAEYLRGAASVIGPGLVGVYGGIRAMQWAARDNVARWFFQTYAWSGGLWYGGNHVEQYHNGVDLAGGVVDLCRARKADFGQWGGEDMTPAQAQQLDDVTWVVDAVNAASPEIRGGRWKGQPSQISVKVNDIDAKVDALAEGGIDTAALAADVAAALAADQTFLAAIAKAVNDDLHARTAE